MYRITYLASAIFQFSKNAVSTPDPEIPIAKQEPNPLPRRKMIDDIVFDALGLTEGERKEVYRAVCQLVWERISKARSVRRNG